MKTESDPRLNPFKDFAYRTFSEEREGLVLPIRGDDIDHLKRMLRETAGREEYDLQHLQWYWLIFLRSTDNFDRKQGRPLRFFASNVTRFAVQLAKPQQQLAGRDWARRKTERVQ